MYLVCVVLVSLGTTVLGHECKKYDLSQTDHSLVDMIQHFLHTFRSKECPTASTVHNIGVTYTRWGRKNCPQGTELVYSGQMGGSYYGKKGGGVNTLCLPNDPDHGKKTSNANVLFGGKFRVVNDSPNGLKSLLNDKEIPCVVCRRKQKSAVLMIPGKKQCYKGWKTEYDGFLFSEYHTHRPSDYACIDRNPEVLDNQPFSKLDGLLMYSVGTSCGSLKCPPYKDKTDVLCVVCTK